MAENTEQVLAGIDSVVAEHGVFNRDYWNAVSRRDEKGSLSLLGGDEQRTAEVADIDRWLNPGFIPDVSGVRIDPTLESGDRFTITGRDGTSQSYRVVSNLGGGTLHCLPITEETSSGPYPEVRGRVWAQARVRQLFVTEEGAQPPPHPVFDSSRIEWGFTEQNGRLLSIIATVLRRLTRRQGG